TSTGGSRPDGLRGGFHKPDGRSAARRNGQNSCPPGGAEAFQSGNRTVAQDIADETGEPAPCPVPGDASYRFRRSEPRGADAGIHPALPIHSQRKAVFSSRSAYSLSGLYQLAKPLAGEQGGIGPQELLASKTLGRDPGFEPADGFPPARRSNFQ